MDSKDKEGVCTEKLGELDFGIKLGILDIENLQGGMRAANIKRAFPSFIPICRYITLGLKPPGPSDDLTAHPA